MRIRVLLFGQEARAVGRSDVDVLLDGPLTCGSLRAALAREVPALWPYLRSGRFAVNHEFADDGRALRETDEVALIGMVSGG
jgi:molybdopterin converting factor small subunit